MQKAVRDQELKVGTPKGQKVCFKDEMEDEADDSISIDEKIVE